MRRGGYLEKLDLGIDEESGEENILVHSATEFARLTEDQKRRAWAVVQVASEILDQAIITTYQHSYKGKLPVKIIKKNVLDRQGLTLIKPFGALVDKQARIKQDQVRMTKVLKRSLARMYWVPTGQRELIVAIVDIKLREIEKETLKNEKGNGTGEGGYEPAEVQ